MKSSSISSSQSLSIESKASGKPGDLSILLSSQSSNQYHVSPSLSSSKIKGFAPKSEYKLTSEPSFNPSPSVSAFL